jgi:hypothetical protein
MNEKFMIFFVCLVIFRLSHTLLCFSQARFLMFKLDGSAIWSKTVF